MQFFGPLRAKAKALSSLKYLAAMRLLFSRPDVQEEVIRLNTREQLFQRGIDAEGVNLEAIGGEYSPVTVIIKQAQGLPTDRVTLYDTGEFYDSFRVEAGPESFTIDANTVKATFDLRERWGLEILGLTDESKEDLALFVRDTIIELLHESLG